MGLYRSLLKLLPKDFRGDFGEEMEAVFDAEREDARRGGRAHVLKLWSRTVAGMLRVAPAEHAAQAAQDSGYALRVLRRNPGFAIASILTLALGIGANTAIFSVVNAVLLKPLPFAHPEALVRVQSANPSRSREGFSLCPPDFREWRSRARTLDGVAAYYRESFNLAGDSSEPERVDGARVSSMLFHLLGREAVIGRVFLPDEDMFGNHRVVLLSHGLWQQRFGGNPAVVGRRILLDSEPVSIVGVMPPDFRFPDADAMLWLPLAFADGDSLNTRGNYFLNAIGRLRSGVSVAEAEAELRRIAADVSREHPASMATAARVVPFREDVVADVRPLLYTLLGAVALVLLIACANVANLLLARRAAREKELAIRAGLGAGRGRLVRQLLTESLVLSAAGGTAGLLVASWGVSLLKSMMPEDLPRLNEVAVDPQVLAFTLALAIATAFLFGIVPAIQGTRLDLRNALKEGGRTSGSSLRRRVRDALVVAEVALALILLAGAGLLLRSFVAVSRVDPGFRRGDLLTASISPPQSRYAKAPELRRLFEDVLERVQAIPGIDSAAIASGMPLEGERWNKMLTIKDGRPLPTSLGTTSVTAYRLVTADYFRTMGVQLVRGRTFTTDDDERAPGVAVINEAMAARQWPGKDPIGATIWMGPPEHLLPGLPPERGFPRLKVVGIVANEHLNALDTPAIPEVYQSYRQSTEGSGARSIAIRASVAPGSIAPSVRAALASVDPEVPLSNIATMEQRIDEAGLARRFNTLLFGAFAAVALALAGIGVYGVIAYSASQRRTEMGIRMALGATRADIFKLVIGQGVALAVVGTAIGIGGALAVTHFLSSLLFAVRPTDPVTLTTSSAVLLAVAAVASYLPARRALAIDPALALRAE